MDDRQLERALNSIGKGCFVKYYEDFRDVTKSNEDLIELIKRNEGFTDTACQTRVTNSRRIIRAGLGIYALELISQSTRLDPSITQKAKRLVHK